MTEYVVTKPGITFDGVVYAEGDTFELADDRSGSNQANYAYEMVRNGKHPSIEKATKRASKELNKEEKRN